MIPLSLLVALASFSPKACQRFCERQGYDFCVPFPTDKEAYICADRVEKSGVFEMPWTATWAPGPQEAPAPDEGDESAPVGHPRWNIL